MRVILIFILLYFMSSCKSSNEDIQNSRLADTAADTLPKTTTITNLSSTEKLGSWKLMDTKKLAKNVKAVNTILHEDGSGKVDILLKDSLKIYVDMKWSLREDTMEAVVSNFIIYQLEKDKQTGEVKEELVEKRGEYTKESKSVVLELTSRKMKVQDIETETIYEYTR